MKKDKRHLKWLSSELPVWQEKGFVTSENSRQIEELYDYNSSNFHWSTVIFAVIGALLIGGGLIMIFGHNWDQLSRGVKASLAFSLVLTGQSVAGFTLWKNKGMAWRESAAVFLNLSLLTGLAIIGQTYQLGGNLEKLLFWWLMISFPTCYLLKSRAATVIYLLVLPGWFGEFCDNNRSEIVKTSYSLLIVWAPVIWLTVRSWGKFYLKGEERLVTTVSFISATISLIIYQASYFHNTILLSMLCFFCFAFLFAVRAGDRNSLTVLGNPLARLTGFALFVFMSTLTFSDAVTEILDRNSLTISGSILVILMTIYAVYMITRKDFYFALFGLIPALAVGGMLINSSDIMSTILMIVFNIYFGIICVCTILKGERDKRLFHVFSGVFWLSLLIYLRFIDSDLELIGKGIAFIIIGIGFLSTNIFFIKRISTAKKEVTHEA